MHKNRSASTTSIARGLIVASILGKKFPVQVTVTNEQADAAENALRATRLLEGVLNSENAKVEKVIALIGEKHAAAIKFERVFGFAWPL